MPKRSGYKHVVKRIRYNSVPCACGVCGLTTVQTPGAGRPRKYLPGHQRKRPELGKCLCGCNKQVIQVNKMGRPPKYYPGHAPTARPAKKEPGK